MPAEAAERELNVFEAGGKNPKGLLERARLHYPASALKERIYVLERVLGQPIQCGILIYTATAGNQGTLGGLVEVTRRFVQIVRSALERERLCSGDPVCADHDPATADDDGAACHGCLLVAETSCEARNLFLDRAMMVDTVGQTGAGFF
jgi:hypothetical protein